MIFVFNRKILTTVYDDTEGEFVDEEFVDVCITLADKNGDGVLQIEGTSTTSTDQVNTIDINIINLL